MDPRLAYPANTQHNYLSGTRLGTHVRHHMRRVTLVCGPPCAGKSYYVEQHAQPGDLILCHDTYAREAGSTHQHNHEPYYRDIAEQRMAQALEYVAQAQDIRAWVIRTAAHAHTRQHLAQGLQADTVLVLIPSIDTLMQRAQRRPSFTRGVIRRWIQQYTPRPGDVVIGEDVGASVPRTRSGKQYQQARERCRRAYGDVCWLCGHDIPDDVPPRHSLSWTLDHVVALAAGGDEWALENQRPAHNKCNAAKGARPAPQAPARTSRRW